MMKKQQMLTGRSIYREGSLTAAPGRNAVNSEISKGVQNLQLDGERNGLIYVPERYDHRVPATLAVMLHGAGGNAEHGLNLIKSYADEHNIILLSPASRLHTWDIIARSAFGADVVFIDQALSFVFTRFVIDRARIAIGGFSDGASYALSLGLNNGQLFTHVIAFSPGFYFARNLKGKPAVFISHGVYDHVLPIQPCSRRIVPDLKRKGYNVHYNEFDGEHVLPASISSAAVEWFLVL